MPLVDTRGYVYKHSIMPDGTFVDTYRRAGEGISDNGGVHWFETLVYHPDRSETETYHYQSLEQALQHHDELLAGSSYTAKDLPTLANRWTSISKDK